MTILRDDALPNDSSWEEILEPPFSGYVLTLEAKLT